MRARSRTHFCTANPKIEQGLSKISNFQETLSTQGLTGKTIIHRAAVISNNFMLSRLLENDLRDQIVNLQLVGFGNEEPFVFYDTFFT